MQEFDCGIVAGDEFPLRFIVDYTGTAPKITELKFNGEHLCTDDNSNNNNNGGDTTTTASENGDTTATTESENENTTPGVRSGSQKINQDKRLKIIQISESSVIC